MSKGTKVFFLVLLCLILVSGRCNSVTPTAPAVQPAHTLTAWPTAIDRGLLYGEPCNPPCWEGITPGSSSEDDVVHILERLKVEERIKSYTKLSATSYLAQFPSGGSLDITLIDGYVPYLTVSYLGSFDYRVRQVIEHFGEPEACHFGFSRPEGGCSCENWDRFGAYAYHSTPGYLLYPSQGVTVLVEVPVCYEGRVCPEMKASVFHYYQPRSLADAFQEGRSPAFGWLDLSSEDVVQWHGYGSGY